jgi:hypothetical protein
MTGALNGGDETLWRFELFQSRNNLSDIRVSNFKGFRDKSLGYLGHLSARQNPDDIFTYYNTGAVDIENAPQSFVERHIGQRNRHIAGDLGAHDKVHINLIGQLSYYGTYRDFIDIDTYNLLHSLLKVRQDRFFSCMLIVFGGKGRDAAEAEKCRDDQEI